MSDRNQNRLLTILGIITAAGTVLIQVLSLGELKGQVQTVISQHGATLSQHSSSISKHGEEIAEIKGKLHGIASQVGRMPGKVAAKLNGGSGDE